MTNKILISDFIFQIQIYIEFQLLNMKITFIIEQNHRKILNFNVLYLAQKKSKLL